MIWCTYLKKPLASSTPSTTTTTKEALSMQGNNCDEGRGKKKDAGKDYCCTRISFRP
nr:unknown [Zea mays]